MSQYRRPSRLRALVFTALVATAVGCGPTYKVNRAALVSPPAPPSWSGQIKQTGLSIGDSTVLWQKAPERAEGAVSGLYVSRTQLDGRLYVQLAEAEVALWFPFSYGFSQAALETTPCLADPPTSGVPSGGLGIAVREPLGDGLYLGIALETQLALIPTHIQGKCIDNCIGSEAMIDKEETSAEAILRGTVLVGHEFEGWRVFGGFSLRNHPTNTKLTTETVLRSEDIDADVSFGPMVILPGIGAEVDVAKAVSIALQLYQPLPLAVDDVIYGPIAGLTVDLHLP